MKGIKLQASSTVIFGTSDSLLNFHKCQNITTGDRSTAGDGTFVQTSLTLLPEFYLGSLPLPVIMTIV